MSVSFSSELLPQYESPRIFAVGTVKRNPDPAKRNNEAINLSQIDSVAKAAGFVIAERSMGIVAPHHWAGNHIHQREEFQVATVGQPIFRYQKEDGEVIDIPMGRDEDGNLNAFWVPKFLPHVVINPDDSPAIINELYDLAAGDAGYQNYRALTPEESLRLTI